MKEKQFYILGNHNNLISYLKQIFSTSSFLLYKNLSIKKSSISFGSSNIYYVSRFTRTCSCSVDDALPSITSVNFELSAFSFSLIRHINVNVASTPPLKPLPVCKCFSYSDAFSYVYLASCLFVECKVYDSLILGKETL